MNTYEDDPPEVFVRCLACGDLVSADWFYVHINEDCDGIGWEDVDER